MNACPRLRSLTERASASRLSSLKQTEATAKQSAVTLLSVGKGAESFTRPLRVGLRRVNQRPANAAHLPSRRRRRSRRDGRACE